MATCVQTVDLESLGTANAREALTCEVRRGLIERPRSLSPWMFYDAEGSRHRVVWNSAASRIEMHLESTREQDVCIEDADLDIHLMRRETVHTENSYKFTDEGIRRLLNSAGFETGGAWKDSRGWYALTLAFLR